MRLILSAVCVVLVARPAVADTADDINRIIDQGLAHSQVMPLAEYLADQIGGRMTNSPAMRQAEAWTQAKFKAWGLVNVHKEGFAFGRGWSIVASSVRMVTPRPITLTAIPVAWTPPTAGPVTAPIVVAPMKKPRDFEAWKGKLAGKIVLVSLPTDGSESTEGPFKRLTEEDMAKNDKYHQVDFDPNALDLRVEQQEFAAKLDAFLKAEKAVAWVRQSYRDGKLVHGEGYLYRVGQTPALPGIDLAAEDYRRLARLAKVGVTPTLEINSNVKYDDSDTNAYNVFAEIRGSDPRAGYVMAGAHLDSWVAGDGAADNGAGSVAIMEAARILAATGVRPKRTIRFALWAGEEEGLLGSLAYVEKYFATRPPGSANESDLAKFMRWRTRFPIKLQPGHKDLAGYFNIDNGSGKLRGIYAEGNVGAVPLLREWLQPFASMGAGAVVAAPTAGTDHVFMQTVGLPGFQFVQDPLDYSSRVHHSSVDTFDHLKAEDLRQASTVLAGVLLEAANSARTLPRMPLPTKPEVSNPYKYDDPDER